MTAHDLPTTTTERLLAVATIVETRSAEWDQRYWASDGGDSAAEWVGTGLTAECGTTFCVAGWAVRLTPPDILRFPFPSDWYSAGAHVLGLTDGTAELLFNSQCHDPGQMATALRALAALPETRRCGPRAREIVEALYQVAPL